MKEENANHHQPRFELSAVITVLGVIGLFLTAIVVTLVAPQYVDPAWTQPSSYYQVQMYEVADPQLYIGRAASSSNTLQFIYHLKQNNSLLAFTETETTRIVAPPELEKYITPYLEPTLKLTPRLLLLRKPIPDQKQGFQAYEAAENLRKKLKDTQDQTDTSRSRLDYQVLELYDPGMQEAFSLADTDGVLESFVGEQFVILDEGVKQPFHHDPGVIYVKNPQEYRVRFSRFGEEQEWKYDPTGEPIRDISQLRESPFRFRTRQEMISLGEEIFSREGCWYCHTDQTRTLVQDVVLNGSESFPAPPSSPNEYIFQKVTFPGTRRIGPDLSRVAVKRPSRDWHKSHFWAPKTTSAGTIMPSFRHLFDDDPRGSAHSPIGIPDYKFEALFQYLMTKGTRITPPTEAWWLGKDPVNTLAIIEGENAR